MDDRWSGRRDMAGFSDGSEPLSLARAESKFLSLGTEIMNVMRKTFVAIMGLTFFGVATLSSPAYADDSGHPPYIVRGNTHILIG
ncbi:MAG TPA: hypothetical protein VIX81_03940, partial [Gammaproteobacteria bacterium]